MPSKRTDASISRVLVLGAYGLIGSAVARRLKQDGFDVVGLGRSRATARAVLPDIEWIIRDFGDLVDRGDRATGLRRPACVFDRLPLTSGWIVASVLLYIFVGLFWLPVVWIQIRLRNLARHALADGSALPKTFDRLYAVWFACGIPAFLAVLVIIWLMLARPGLSWIAV